MGTGFGRGSNRAMEAAQEAISSPLLDNISIQGASGVLINITGGMDLAIDEVTTINQIIQDAAGEEAEIIFGAVHDPHMKEEVRVTVIATGFDRSEERIEGVIRPIFGQSRKAEPHNVYVQQQQQVRAAAGGGSSSGPVPMGGGGGRRSIERGLPSDLEIPTFIRRQMD
jgi:cell division protein FtsZ